MKVRITAAARSQLRSIHDFIARDQPRRADEVVRRLLDKAQTIGRPPLGGRRLREYDDERVREVIEAPFRIIYRVGADAIDVLAIMHSRQLLPRDLD